MNPLLKRISILVGIVLASIFLPYIGEIIVSKGSIPADFFNFPPAMTDHAAKAPFNLVVFISIALVCLAIVVFYLFPTLFGFKKVKVPASLQKMERGKIPVWFWLGAFLMFGAMFFMWGKFSGPKFITNWTLLPLFWGAIIFFDGIVYYRTNGRSLINDRPQTLIAIAVCSIGGWAYFEYLNFFVKENWYYPAGNLISTEQFIVYSLLGSSALLTIAFELYMLLESFPKLAVKYTQGPKLVVSKKVWKIILVLSLLIMFLIGIFPDEMFFFIWLAPLLLFLSILEIYNIWTPFTPISKTGNWAPFALMCLTYLIQGFFHEFWNYFSAIHLPTNEVITYNPGFWQYSIPYVNVLHVFEMPVLGFFGYLPFGLYCWVAWLLFAELLGINPKFENTI
jgi:hypothetical protein